MWIGKKLWWNRLGWILKNLFVRWWVVVNLYVKVGKVFVLLVLLFGVCLWK